MCTLHSYDFRCHWNSVHDNLSFNFNILTMKIQQKIFLNLRNTFKTKPFTRMDIQKAIWIAQGMDINKFVNRSGNYGTNIQTYLSRGLLEKPKKNTYMLSNLGKVYADNPNVVNKLIRDKKKAKQKKIDNLPHNVHRTNFTHLIGRKIVNVRHLTPQECANFGWNKSPLALFLDDWTCLIPQTDDEGNDGGAMKHVDLRTYREDYIKESVLYTL